MTLLYSYLLQYMDVVETAEVLDHITILGNLPILIVLCGLWME